MKEDNITANMLELEFGMNTSAGLLFNRLSTPSGLSEWFADDVNLSGNIFTFIWDKMEHLAEVIEKKENKHIRFRWIDHPDYGDNHTFEFKLSVRDITGELSLQVTETISEDDEVEDVISLWNYQISELKRVLGI